jgi:hypothetical protein
MQKQPTIRSEKHRRFIASLPCVKTGKSECQAAHIRHGYLGMGIKPPDSRCVPLNYQQHALQHSIGEKKFWGHKIDQVIWLAGLLWDNTGNREKCIELIAEFRHD